MAKRRAVDDPNVKKMGFWNTDDPEEVRKHRKDKDWDLITAVLAFMNAASANASYRGTARCRLCGDRLGGSDMLTPDGKWVFPAGWEHYIVQHGLAPTDDEFGSAAESWFKTVRESWE